MIIGRKVPVFLWEYAVAHAMYLRDRAYHKSLEKTPYELWNKNKPNISHLREFGAPVWVLLQGQKKPPKLQPRSKKYIYIGCEDGLKSIKYYNPETRNVLTSRNFQFIDVPSQKPPPEDITIFPFDPMCEGENSGGNTHQTNGNKRKRMNDLPSDVGEQPPRKMRERKNVDYRLLNDPFPDEEQNENKIIKEAENAYQIQTETPLGGNDPLCQICGI
jgi:hypothetical protein